MPQLRVALLGLAVLGVLAHPRRVPAWAAPVAAVGVALAVGAVGPSDAWSSTAPLRAPLAFLLAAVPLAVLLDGLGFFAAVARRADRGAHLERTLWIFAAVVTTVLNLDAAVVLLTPLFVRVARRRGLDPLLLAAQPVLLASLASSALPVSNLTNLLAGERWSVGAAGFLLRLGPASLAASVVGWRSYRRMAARRPAPVDAAASGEALGSTAVGTPGTDATPDADEGTLADGTALAVGGAVVAAVLVGVTVGEALGVPPWAVVLAADAVLVAIGGRVPWRSIPFGTGALAAGLGVLAASAAPHLGLGSVLGGDGVGAEVRAAGAGIVGASTINNLPALLVGFPHLGDRASSVGWAFLAAVNVAPVLVATGSLAGLLWLDTLRRLGVPAGARTYTRLVGRLGAPAAGVGLVVVLLTNRLA